MGAGLSQGHSTTLGIDSGLFRRFQASALCWFRDAWPQSRLDVTRWLQSVQLTTSMLRNVQAAARLRKHITP